MLLLFLRHAEAEAVSTGDFQRRLTVKGLEQAGKVGKFCVRTGLVPDLILSSPVVRAKQTAELVAEKLGGPELVILPGMACGMSPSTCLDELTPYSKFGTIMLVGHEPDFSGVISVLVGCEGMGAIRVRKASLTGVTTETLLPGRGQLQFAIPVRLM